MQFIQGQGLDQVIEELRQRDGPDRKPDESLFRTGEWEASAPNGERGTSAHTGQLKKELFWYNRVSEYKRYQRRFP
jgi:hypothetical protein